MADTSTTKLGEITKKFKAVNKEVIARLSEYGETVKASTSVITEEQATMVVDILTQDNLFTAEEIEELRKDAVSKKEKEEEAVRLEAEAQAKAEEAARKAEEKAKAEAKKAAREASEAEAKAKRKAEEKEKREKQKKHVNPAKKQSGVRVDLSGMGSTESTEEFIVKSEKKSRTVDTRSSNVDLKKLEKKFN